jgi:hypothetical protein
MTVGCALALAALPAAARANRDRRTDPFATAAMRSFLDSRGGDVTAAVENLWTGRTYLYRPGVREHTASIVKMDILETLLRQLAERHRQLSGAQAATAQGMIEASDNDDATTLWNDVGGVGAYDRLAGLTQTAPNVAWGLTSTTPLDQIRLLRELVGHPSLLSKGAQLYELGLMSHVEASERWGVSGGVPGGVAVALKNGWLPESGGWQINSVGRIKGDDRDYLIAVMTSGDPSYDYGISTIKRVSAIVFRELAERAAGRWGSGVGTAG